MRLRNSLFTTLNKLFLALITFLGFSCDPDGPWRVEYGSPHADFIVNGSIVDESTLNELSNIQVVMDYDTVYSNENGNYEIKVTNSPQSQIYTISFKDIDGALNGAFLPTDTVVDFSDEQFKNGDGSWYSGEKSKEINIKLNPDETL